MVRRTKLRIHFVHPFDDAKLTAKIDPDLRPSEVIDELIAADFLEKRPEIEYHLSVRGGRLNAAKSLRKSGVKDGSEVMVTTFEENA